MTTINFACLVIVVISFALVAAYMAGVHYFVSDSEKDGNDSSH